jgi:hypothetical protein
MARRGKTIIASARLPEVRDVFIENAVAIVIERIARLVIGRTATSAHACGEGARPAPAHTRNRNAARAFRSSCAGADAADLHGGWRGHGFVDRAIAVIIHAIASFGWRNVRASVFAFLVAIEVIITRLATLENAHSAGAGPIRVDCAGVAIIAAGSAIGDVRLQIGLVRQLSVAIGIDAAGVGGTGWSNRTIALDDATRAALGSSHTGARSAHGRRNRNVARAGRITGGHARGRIDCAIAVIVDTVARFRGRIDRSDADDRAALALLGPEGAREDIRRSTRAAGIGRIVVDCSVTVIVDAIAGFGDGIDGPDTYEHPILALLRSEFTRPDVGLSALRANADGTIIHHSVAIVIETIASFRLRICSSHANEAAGLTLEGPELARADVGLSALRTDSCRHVIDYAIAIVVLSIAGFRLGIDSSNTAQRAACTLRRSKRARERIALTARNAGSLRSVIDRAIAIVIDAVTHFRRRIDGSNAGHLPILALDGAQTAGRRPALTALSPNARNVVINHSVAIVIDGIAGLSRWIDRADTLQGSTDALDSAEHAGHRIRLTARNADSLRGIVDHAVAIVVDSVTNFH